MQDRQQAVGGPVGVLPARVDLGEAGQHVEDARQVLGRPRHHLQRIEHLNVRRPRRGAEPPVSAVCEHRLGERVGFGQAQAHCFQDRLRFGLRQQRQNRGHGRPGLGGLVARCGSENLPYDHRGRVRGGHAVPEESGRSTPEQRQGGGDPLSEVGRVPVPDSIELRAHTAVAGEPAERIGLGQHLARQIAEVPDVAARDLPVQQQPGIRGRHDVPQLPGRHYGRVAGIEAAQRLGHRFVRAAQELLHRLPVALPALVPAAEQQAPPDRRVNAAGRPSRAMEFGLFGEAAAQSQQAHSGEAGQPVRVVDLHTGAVEQLGNPLGVRRGHHDLGVRGAGQRHDHAVPQPCGQALDEIRRRHHRRDRRSDRLPVRAEESSSACGIVQVQHAVQAQVRTR